MPKRNHVAHIVSVWYILLTYLLNLLISNSKFTIQNPDKFSLNDDAC